MPYAYPWQPTIDGALLRFVYCPGEWKKLPITDVPTCSGCGASFRKTKQLGDFVWFQADCLAKHVSDR